MRLLILTLFLFLNCASTGLSIKPPEPPRDVSDSDLIEAPAEERTELPEASGGPTVLDKGEVVPFDGVLIDERKAAETIAIRAERDRRMTEIVILKRLSLQKDYLFFKALHFSKVSLGKG